MTVEVKFFNFANRSKYFHIGHSCAKICFVFFKKYVLCQFAGIMIFLHRVRTGCNSVSFALSILTAL